MSITDNSNILITGSSSWICSFLVNKLLEQTNFTIVLTYHKNKGDFFTNNRLIFERANLLNPQLFDIIIKKYKPKYVVHLAAMARVNDGETEPEKTVKANLIATAQIAKYAIKYNVDSMIFTSSNLAQDAVSVVGLCKLLSEQYFQLLNSSKTKFVSVRMPNVIDSVGSVTLLFKKLIKNNKPITITHPKMNRMFITGEQAADLLYYLINEGVNKSVYVSYKEPLLIIDLANELIKKSGKSIKIEIIGMKPGEKIMEKGFAKNELIQAKNGIGIIETYEYNCELVTKSIKKLNTVPSILGSKSIQDFFSNLISI